MANIKDNKENKKINEKIALAEEKYTEEEYERRRREKQKERIGNFLKIAGILAIVFMTYICVLEPLFELTLFGVLFTREEFYLGWAGLDELGIFDNVSTGLWLQESGKWFGTIGVTSVYILVLTLLVYLVTLYTTELIMLIRHAAKTAKALFKETSQNITEGISDATADIKKSTPKKKKKDLFENDPLPLEIGEEQPKKVVKEKKEKKKKEPELDGYTSEDLDRLLSGEVLIKDEPEVEEKQLFDIPLEEVEILNEK